MQPFDVTTDRDELPTEVQFFLEIEWDLWILAFVFFGVGDLLTTHIGLLSHQVVEVGPFVAPIIVQYGTTAMIGLKSAAFVGCFGLYSVVPTPHKVGVPLGLSVLGILVTFWNIALIVATAM